jgi:hypothetical protein
MTAVPHATAPLAAVRDASTPRCFEHDLPAELFGSDALDEICRAADARGQLTVQLPDTSRERLGQRPEYTKPRYPILADALERPVHYRIFNTATWGPREHAECRARLQELAGPHRGLGDIPRETVVRVFSPHALDALHGDPDAKLVAGIAGTTVWNVRPVHAMSQLQHENLLRGEFFLPFTDDPEERALRLDPGGACFVPARWAHWLEHPCEDASVTFDVGFYTRNDLRDRKVYDVNWLLRKAHLAPGGPGGRGDRLNCLAFDAISTVTRRGLEYRGQV